MYRLSDLLFHLSDYSYIFFSIIHTPRTQIHNSCFESRSYHLTIEFDIVLRIHISAKNVTIVYVSSFCSAAKIFTVDMRESLSLRDRLNNVSEVAEAEINKQCRRSELTL